VKPIRTAAAALFAAIVVATTFACSGDNQEGPDVTCEDLECGRVNACQDGIIAQCVDGVTVRWHACGDEYLCSAGWQIPGAYRCGESHTDCEGCRPERELGCGEGGFEPGYPFLPQGGGGEGGGDTGGGGGA
jgi:hypothetical protein